MSKIVDMNTRRPPVTYTIRVTQHWDGTIETFVEDVSDDERSREAVARAMERIAISYLKKHPADAMHAIMLANIDSAMSATDTEPAVFRICPGELRSWAEAVEEWETARYGAAAPSPTKGGEDE